MNFYIIFLINIKHDLTENENFYSESNELC